MNIRAARLADAPALARVIVDTFLSAHRDHMPEEAWLKRKQEWTYEVSERGWVRSLREIAEGASSDCIYVAEEDGGAIVGLGMGVPSETEDAEPTGEVVALYVRESHQRRGIGRHLVQAIAADLAQKGIHRLRIGCDAANARGRRFYEAIGGRVVAERESEDDGFPFLEVVYGWEDTRALVAAGRGEPEGGER